MNLPNNFVQVLNVDPVSVMFTHVVKYLWDISSTCGNTEQHSADTLYKKQCTNVLFSLTFKIIFINLYYIIVHCTILLNICLLYLPTLLDFLGISWICCETPTLQEKKKISWIVNLWAVGDFW